VRAVLLDALGTLVRLEPPGPRLRAALRELSGVDVGAPAAEAAFRAEIAYYLAHHTEGGDPAGLERLRDDCAAVMHEALAAPELGCSTVRRAMLASLRFTAYADVAPALEALRPRRLVVVSNWDCALGGWLDAAGLGGALDAVVTSAEVGEAKPGPAVFETALARVGVEAADAVHVGDSLENDVEGARAAGMRAILVAREGPLPAGVEAVRSLAELRSLV